MSEPSDEKQKDEHPEVAYMDDVVPRLLVLRVLLWAGVFSIALCVIAYLLMVANERAIRPDRKFPERYLPAPHEVANVRQEPFSPATPASTLNDDERVLLRSYGWVDRQKGLVRIPIDRAVELMMNQAAREGGQR